MHTPGCARSRRLPKHDLFLRALWVAVCVVWIGGTCLGIAKLWSYDGKAGEAANTRSTWPDQSSLKLSTDVPTLVLSLHPHCPCSRATVGELAKLMTDCRGKLAATVLMIRPAGKPEGWEQTDLWRSAAAIPGVSIVSDVEGKESNRFGALTSGQAFLYSPEGRLLFAGGITESRGHSGDNAGRTQIFSVLQDARPGGHCPVTPVYGCGLFNPVATGGTAGRETCPN